MKKESATVAQNRRARFEYEILERFEAGIVLTGMEIKAVRAGRVDLAAAYAKIKGEEVWLINMILSQAGLEQSDRTRKLLLQRREINRLIGLAEQKGYALVPMRLYFHRGKAKIELAVARGRKSHDKREVIKKRDYERELRRTPSK